MKNIIRDILLAVLVLFIGGCSSMTSILKLAKDYSSFADMEADYLVYTETDGSMSLRVEVSDSKFIEEALDAILNSQLKTRGEYVDMYRLREADYCFYYGDKTYSFSFVPDSYFYYDGKYYEMGESSMSKIRDYLYSYSLRTNSALWYSDKASLDIEFVDNGDEARSLLNLTLTVFNETLEGYIEGGYDVLSVDRRSDMYIVEYTYGDFYSHDAVKKCAVKVENGELVISDIEN